MAPNLKAPSTHASRVLCVLQLAISVTARETCRRHCLDLALRAQTTELASQRIFPADFVVRP